MDLQLFALAGMVGGVDLAANVESRRVLGGIRRLPIDGPKADLESIGFVFGEKIDDLFMEVLVAPEGWSYRSSDIYHNHVDDENGVERIYVFYHSWDRAAYMRLQNRYYTAFDTEPMPPMVKATRWCRMGKERGYDVVVEVMSEDFTPPRSKGNIFAYMDADGEYFYSDHKRMAARGMREDSGPTYARREVDVYETEPKPYNERTHRYIAKDRVTGFTLFEGDWIKNGDHSSEAEVKQKVVTEFLEANFPEYQNPLRYW